MFLQAPKIVDDLLKVLMADLDGYFGELGQEMKAIADYWEVDLGIVVSLNLAYVLRRVRVHCSLSRKSVCARRVRVHCSLSRKSVCACLYV